MKRILVTGAYGFLGRHTASLFKQKGCTVVGIGHGHWGFENPEDFGIDEWIEADIDQVGLSHITGHIDCVIHCAGGSSVGASIKHPFRELQRTVESTVNVLEFLRTKHPCAKLIYPSSAAVYGNQPDVPLPEDYKIVPFSPYGFYKKIVEDLCESYARNFGISSVIIRFFSVYGAGLQKQLLWDGCNKLSSGKEAVSFYGTGNETRDWLHVKDAAKLIYLLSNSPRKFEIVNGGSGIRIAIKEILSLLSIELQTSTNMQMGNENRPGDPKHYWADISKAQKLGWEPHFKIEDGLREYVQWFTLHKQGLLK
ncbi:MAG: NAD(P)-dependent oxidoreductase [Desulfobacterales bacterium]|nr:NAD(P)-dependent oxidoreductase [Desulfobacterales bacterium]